MLVAPSHRHFRRKTYFVLVLLVTLVACSSDSESPLATVPRESAPTATPTFQPGQVRVGDLLARVEQSWAGVSNMRSVFTASETPGRGTATPVALSEVIVDEIKPDRRRIVIRENGVVSGEQIAIGETIYLRGAFVSGLVAPNVDSQTWVTVDPSPVPPESPVGRQLAALRTPITPPFQSVSAETRALPATPAGNVQIGGQTCDAYTFTTNDPRSGGAIMTTLMLDDEGRLCALERSAARITNRTVFSYNLPDLAIEPPFAATPVSGTPEG